MENNRNINDDGYTVLIVNLFLRDPMDLRKNYPDNPSINFVQSRVNEDFDFIVNVLSDSESIKKHFPEDGEFIVSYIEEKLPTAIKDYKEPTKNIKEDPKIDINNFLGNNKNNDAYFYVLLQLALTFRVKTETLETLVGISQKDLDFYLRCFNKYSNNAIDFLNNYDYTDQTIAVENLLIFYKEFLFAKQNKDRQKLKELVSLYDDNKALQLKNRLKKNDIKTDEDILIILQFKNKWGMIMRDISEIFDINRTSFISTIKSFFNRHPELNELKELTEYIGTVHKNKGYYGRRKK